MEEQVQVDEVEVEEVEELQMEEQAEELPEAEAELEEGEAQEEEPIEEPAPAPAWSRPHAFVERQKTWHELMHVRANFVLNGIAFTVKKADEKKVQAEAKSLQDEFKTYWTECVRVGGKHQLGHERHWLEITKMDADTLMITVVPTSPPEVPRYMQAALALKEMRAEMGVGEDGEDEPLDEEPIDQADDLSDEEDDLQDDEDPEPVIDLDDYLADQDLDEEQPA